MITAEVVDPRTEPEPDGWPGFTRRRALLPVWTFELLRREAWLTRNPPVLVVVRDGGEIVAAVTAMVCRPGRRRFAASRPPGPHWADAYVPVFGGHPAVVFADGLDVPGRRTAVRVAERALARRLGAGLLGMVYRVVEPDVLPAVSGRGRLVRATLPTTVLRNRWPDVDGWLASLGRERRQGIRRYARKIERDPSLEVRSGPGRADLDPHELAGLLTAHQVRLGTPRFDHRTPVAGAYLAELVRRPDVHTLTYRDAADGRLLAFNTLVDHPETPVLHFWAARPVSDGGRYNLYFDCYLRCVRHMVEHGRPALTAGRGLLEVKASLGFEPQPRYAVVAPRPGLGR
jgi:hypothetical protein